MATFNILKDGPTITYPNGGETFAEGEISIQWREPINIESTDLIWYEIFITDNYYYNTKNDLLKIAIVPYGVTSFIYSIPSNIKSDKCRIGIRAINQEGTRSRMSFSANNFTITNKQLPMPSVFEPVSGKSYFSYLPFVFDHNAIVGRASQKAFYQVYAKSDSRDIDWYLLRGEIRVGSDPFNIDTGDMEVASDYMFRIELVDGDNVSLPVLINNITINNINYFLIDTLPPRGSVTIENNTEYTNKRELILKIDAFDETTGVKDYFIKQIDVGSDTSPDQSPYIDYSELSTWQIPNDSPDGVKLIQASFRDYADNEVSSSGETYFRTYKELDNETITTFITDGESIYYTFSTVDPSISSPSLYKDLNLLSTLDYEATSMCFYNDILYIAIKDDENKGILQRYDSAVMQTVMDNTEEYLDEDETILNSLYYADSVVNSMVSYDGKLFMGMQNGRLLSFNGSVITVEQEGYLNIKSIKRLSTDGTLLYIFFENSQNFHVMYKDENEDYVLESITMSV